MSSESINILSREADGGLVVQAGPGAARLLHKWGASRRADGTWTIPQERRARFERHLQGKSRPPRPPRPVAVRAEIPGRLETSAIKDFIEALTVPDLKISYRTPLLVCLRLARPSKPALTRIRGIPGRRWNPNQGCWEIPTRSPADLEQISVAISEIAELLKQDVESVRPRRQVEEIFPIDAAPLLFEPIPLNGGVAVFDRTSRLFRLHEGHGRQHPHLAGQVGKYGCVLYGDWQTPPAETQKPGAASTVGASSAST